MSEKRANHLPGERRLSYVLLFVLMLITLGISNFCCQPVGVETSAGFLNAAARGLPQFLFVTGTIFSLLVFGFAVRDSKRRSDLASFADELKSLNDEREQILRQEQKARRDAEDATRVRDEFLRIISHELKTPLNAIGGWARILRSREVSSELHQRALEHIENNVRLQAKMVRQMVSFTQTVGIETSLDKQLISAKEIIEQAIASTADLAAERNINIFFQAADVNCLINIDRDLFKVAVTNVLENGIKFSRSQNTVRIGMTCGPANLKIDVNDHGIGIAPDFLPKVFDTYTQADRSAARRFGGLGLGLAIAKRVVEMHGGEIAITSGGIGSGANVSIVIPATISP